MALKQQHRKMKADKRNKSWLKLRKRRRKPRKELQNQQGHDFFLLNTRKDRFGISDWRHTTLLALGGPEHYTFLGNCPPTPPLRQHFALSEK